MKAGAWKPALICLVGAAGHAAAADPALYLIGKPVGAQSSRVMGLSADGTVAAGISNFAFPNNNTAPGFVWTASSGRTDLGPPPTVTGAASISSDGSTVVGLYGPSGRPQAFRRVGNGPFEVLGILPGYSKSLALGTSGDGSVVVGKSEIVTSISGQAFRWTVGGGLQGLGFLRPNGSFSAAYDVSDDGNTVVGLSQSGGLSGTVEAFRWTAATGMQPLPQLAGTSDSVGVGISRDGTVIVGHASNSGHTFAVRWRNGTVEELAPAPGITEWGAKRTNGDGTVVIGLANAMPFDNNGVVWTELTGVMLLTDYPRSHGVTMPADAVIPFCEVVSADGLSFGGVMLSPSTGNQGFVATIPSSSTTLGAPVVLCHAVIPRRRRRRNRRREGLGR